MNFQESLEELMKQKGVNALDIERVTKLPNSGIYNYLNYGKDASLTNLIVLADYFGVCLDYLAGRTDQKERSGRVEAASFPAALAKLLSENGISKYKLTIDLKLSNNQVRKWLGGSVPRLSSLILLADYFNCSIDDLAKIDAALRGEKE